MKKWTIEQLQNVESSDDHSVTCIGDCYELAYFEGNTTNNHERGYAIYKLLSQQGNVYVMQLKDNSSLNPPVLLSEEKTLFLLNNPKEAKNFAFDVWLNRYR